MKAMTNPKNVGTDKRQGRWFSEVFPVSINVSSSSVTTSNTFGIYVLFKRDISIFWSFLDFCHFVHHDIESLYTYKIDYIQAYENETDSNCVNKKSHLNSRRCIIYVCKIRNYDNKLHCRIMQITKNYFCYLTLELYRTMIKLHSF